jgi:signal transduction histidine kinase
MPAGRDDEQELLSLIAHEISSPASVVAGYVRFLVKGSAGELTDSQRKMLDEAGRSCTRILELMRELRDLSALRIAEGPAEVQPVKIVSLCEDVVRAAAHGGGAENTFRYADADRGTVVEGDGDRLRQALTSFIAAIQRERGSDRVSVYGFIANTDSGSNVVIVIGGEEMTPDNTILERTAAFDRWRGGLGMALPIACSIVEAHGGRVVAVPGQPYAATALVLPAAGR